MSIAMVELACPNCGFKFAAVAVESDGFCLCGADFAIDAGATVVRWKPDPAFTPSFEPVEIKLRA